MVSDHVLRGFRGGVAEYYARFRRGYPPPVLDVLVATFGLDHADLAIDLGCGTGQLTLPLAERVRGVVGVDPEPDMLSLASAAARTRGVRNASWMLGFDSDLPALAELIEPGAVAAITAATAIHWMDHAALFRTARPMLRDGGGIAVVTNGAPLWLQDTDWSHALRTVIEDWTGHDAGFDCGTGEAARAGYRTEMSAAGYTTAEVRVEYEAKLDIEAAIGSLFSAMSNVDVEDPTRRRDFADRVRAALAPRIHLDEHVAVIVQTGIISS